MNLIDRIDEAGKERLQTERGCSEVPEWPEPDGTALKIYYKPVTAKDQDAYFKLVHELKAEGHVEMVIRRARDDNGAKLFTRAQKDRLMASPFPDVFVRIGNEMMAYDNDIAAADKALEKNSETTRSSSTSALSPGSSDGARDGSTVSSPSPRLTSSSRS